MMAYLAAMLLLAIANGAPILARSLLGDRLASPMDGGLCFIDGRPLLGSAKTVRGVVVSVLATTTAATGLGLDWSLGVLVATAAMLGDLGSSFVKRRLDCPPSSRVPVLDQLPEALLPLVVLRQPLALEWWEVAGLAGVFFLFDVLLSPLLYWLRIRRRPY